MSNLGLYVHIPFCVSKCAYCDFYSSNIPDKDYIPALLSHIKESKIKTKDVLADTIYIGGGTPTILEIKDIKKILKTIKKSFNIPKDAEITIEANPDTVDLNYLKALKKIGINRISFGIQSIFDNELSVLGRLHDYQTAKTAVLNAKKAGFDNISVDLMYGIYHQTFESFSASLIEITTLPITHISIYCMKLSENVPLYHRWDLPIVGDDIQADMYLFAVQALKNAGFEQYEISNFAKPGFRSRHNHKYWTLAPYLGFGPSAHSFMSNTRFSCVPNTKEYINGIKNKGSVTEYDEQMELKECAREYVMLSLRTVEGVSLMNIEKKYHLTTNGIEELFTTYVRMGYARRVGSNYHLTPEGFFVSNTIINAVLDKLNGAQNISFKEYVRK